MIRWSRRIRPREPASYGGSALRTGGEMTSGWSPADLRGISLCFALQYPAAQPTLRARATGDHGRKMVCAVIIGQKLPLLNDLLLRDFIPTFVITARL